MADFDREQYDRNTEKIAMGSYKATMSIINELGVRGGANMPSTVPMKKVGEMAVKGAAMIAPGAVAAASTGTAATVTGTAAAAATVIGTTAATALAPVAVVCGTAYGVYRLVKWIGN